MSIVIGILYTLVAAVLAVTTMLGLPGIWLMIALAGVIDLTQVILGTPVSFGWIALAIAVVLGIVAEIVEFLAGAAGAKAGGANRSGMVGAILGGFVGAVAGTFLIPIPLVGTFIGAAIGAGLGAFIGEISREDATVKTSLKPAGGAAVGKVAGTLMKSAFAGVVWIVLVVAAFV